MVVKIYVSGISGNKEVKKKQQRVQMILDSKSVSYEAIDITEPGREKDKETMQQKSKVREALGKHPLPPQIFNDEEYCGDYDDFDMANEVDALEAFLHLPIPSKLSREDSVSEKLNGSREESDGIQQNGGSRTEMNGDVELSPVEDGTANVGPSLDAEEEEQPAEGDVDTSPDVPVVPESPHQSDQAPTEPENEEIARTEETVEEPTENEAENEEITRTEETVEETAENEAEVEKETKNIALLPSREVSTEESAVVGDEIRVGEDGVPAVFETDLNRNVLVVGDTLDRSTERGEKSLIDPAQKERSEGEKCEKLIERQFSEEAAGNREVEIKRASSPDEVTTKTLLSGEASEEGSTNASRSETLLGSQSLNSCTSIEDETIEPEKAVTNPKGGVEERLSEAEKDSETTKARGSAEKDEGSDIKLPLGEEVNILKAGKGPDTNISRREEENLGKESSVDSIATRKTDEDILQTESFKQFKEKQEEEHRLAKEDSALAEIKAVGDSAEELKSSVCGGKESDLISSATEISLQGRSIEASQAPVLPVPAEGNKDLQKEEKQVPPAESVTKKPVQENFKKGQAESFFGAGSTNCEPFEEILSKEENTPAISVAEDFVEAVKEATKEKPSVKPESTANKSNLDSSKAPEELSVVTKNLEPSKTLAAEELTESKVELSSGTKNSIENSDIISIESGEEPKKLESFDEELDEFRPLVRRDTLKHIKRPSLPLIKSPSRQEKAPAEDQKKEEMPARIGGLAIKETTSSGEEALGSSQSEHVTQAATGVPTKAIMFDMYTPFNIDRIKFTPQLVAHQQNPSNPPKSEGPGVPLRNWDRRPTEIDVVKEVRTILDERDTDLEISRARARAGLHQLKNPHRNFIDQMSKLISDIESVDEIVDYEVVHPPPPPRVPTPPPPPPVNEFLEEVLRALNAPWPPVKKTDNVFLKKVKDLVNSDQLAGNCDAVYFTKEKGSEQEGELAEKVRVILDDRESSLGIVPKAKAPDHSEFLGDVLIFLNDEPIIKDQECLSQLPQPEKIPAGVERKIDAAKSQSQSDAKKASKDIEVGQIFVRDNVFPVIAKVTTNDYKIFVSSFGSTIELSSDDLEAVTITVVEDNGYKSDVAKIVVSSNKCL